MDFYSTTSASTFPCFQFNCLFVDKKFSLFLKFTFLYHITLSNETRLGLRAHGVVSERFHSEIFQKAPDLLTKFNGNSKREPRLWTISQ